MSTTKTETADTVEQVRTTADNLRDALAALDQATTPDAFPGLYDGVQAVYPFVVEGDLTLREDPNLAEDEEVTLVVTARVRKVKRDTIRTVEPVTRVNYTLDLTSIDIVNGRDVASDPQWYETSQRYYDAWNQWFHGRLTTFTEQAAEPEKRTGLARFLPGQHTRKAG